MPPEDFAAFILTHGRPDNVITLKTLRHHGYTGPIYLVVDNEDLTLDDYRARYENVVVFDKAAVAAKTQCADNQPGHSGVVIFARNACFDIARSLGITYFIQLDDDYYDFSHRFDRHDAWKSRVVRNLDAVFEAMLRFYKETPFLTLAMVQGGDMFAGYAKSIQMFRKAMNSFICSTDRPFAFTGRVNEDVNTYVSLGTQGFLFGSINRVCIGQEDTQRSDGGMADFYREQGTYAKSFYPVLYSPSSVRVQAMQADHPRIHHRINWNATVPKIIHESCRKPRNLEGLAA